MATPYKRKYPRKFSQLNDPDISDEQKIALTREFATKYPKDFNKALDKISPDPYRGTRKLADMLIQQYPDRFPGATPDDVVNVLQKIAKTESKDQNIAQMKGGPGRGYFQIETTTAPTALKRYQNYQDILAPLSAVPLPKIAPTPGKPVKIAGEKVPTANVMNLSKDQQAMLALSNIAANAKSKGIVDVANPMDTWLNYHWAGSPEQRPERAQHWVDTFQSGYGKGGKLTKKGKKIRKYGPRPDYMNQNPAGMKTGPIQQRSIGNTPGGGYMSFADGGNIPTWSPGMIGPPPMPMGFSPEQRERLGLYTEQGPNPYNLQYNIGKYTGVPAGMSQHYSGETGISNSPCGPGFAIDYDENGYEVCVPIGLKSSKAASPTVPSPIPSSGGSYQYYPELGYSTTPERYALVMRNRNNLASKPAEPQGASDEVIYSIERSRPETSFSFAGFSEKPSKNMAGEPEAKRKLRKGKSFHRGTGLSRFFSNVGEAVSRCLPGEDCPKMEHGGWVYPANIAYPARTKFEDGSKVIDRGELVSKGINYYGIADRPDKYSYAEAAAPGIIGNPGLERGYGVQGVRGPLDYLNPYGQVGVGVLYDPIRNPNSYFGAQVSGGVSPRFERHTTEYRKIPVKSRDFTIEQSDEPETKVKKYVKPNYWSFNPNLSAGVTASTDAGIGQSSQGTFKTTSPNYTVTPYLSPGAKIDYNYYSEGEPKHVGLYGQAAYSPGYKPQYEVGATYGGHIPTIDTDYELRAGIRPDMNAGELSGMQYTPFFGATAKYYIGGKSPEKRRLISTRYKQAKGGKVTWQIID